MIQTDRLFGNLFDDRLITSTRLCNFAGDTLNHFTIANTGGIYTALINQLTGPLTELKNELGKVDKSANLQKGSTLTNNQVVKEFKSTMSNEEPFVAKAVGGRGSAVYLQFYPQGINEYSTASKTNMTILTQRVNTAATANAVALGAELAGNLQRFEVAWKNSRSSQQQQKGNTAGSRSERTIARAGLEMTLTYCVHTIAAMFPTNVEQCSGFFDFTLLRAQPRRRHQTMQGTLTAGQVITIVDRTFTDTVNLTIRNPDDNAAIAVWLAPNGEESTPPAAALQVQPGRTAHIKPSELGPLANPFLLVKNLSTVNEGAYEVVIA